MKDRIVNVLTNRYFISLVITTVLITLLPEVDNRYTLELLDTSYHGRKDRLYFEDLDSDGISEKIIVRKNVQNQASYIIRNNNDQVIDQFNFDSNFSNKDHRLHFLDYDQDGFKEIYNITHRQDSLLLNITEPLDADGANRKGIFIDILPLYKNSLILSDAYEIRTRSFYLQNGFGSKPRILFECSSGFLQYPRNIYAYDVSLDSIYKSSYLTNSSTITQVLDIDLDGKGEILTSTASSNNALDSLFTKKSDSSSWVTVLDDDLSFMFNPIENPSKFSSTYNFAIKNNGSYKILSLFNAKREPEIQSALRLYDLTGNLQEEIQINKGLIYSHYDEKENTVQLYNRTNGNLAVFNVHNLEKVQSLNFQKNINFKRIGLDGDDFDEIAALSQNKKELTIYRSNFEDSVSLKLPGRSEGNAYKIGLYNQYQNRPMIWIQNFNELYSLAYEPNKLYYLKYPIYVLIYLAILGLVMLIMKAQSIQEAKKRRLETQISELQLITVKNQLDPHFVFNAMNTISEMTLTDNKMEADQYITEFSSLMRKTLRGSDKIAHSLQEELEYIENYIRLQRIRFPNGFEYSISVDKTVNQKTAVPKHVLYTYVENAIKHGLSKCENGKLLVEIAQVQEGTLVLAVEDNGRGFGKSSAKKENSTGNGLKIMEQLFTLYEKRFKKEIAVSYHESNGSIEDGTRVEVQIS